MRIEENKKTKLRKLMEARNLTNEKLAQSSGVNVSVLINLSIGNRDLNIKYAEALAPSLGVSVRYLMEEKPDPKMLLLENLENIRKDGNSIFPGVDLSSTVDGEIYNMLNLIYDIYTSRDYPFLSSEISNISTVFRSKIENSKKSGKNYITKVIDKSEDISKKELSNDFTTELINNLIDVLNEFKLKVSK